MPALLFSVDFFTLDGTLAVSLASASSMVVDALGDDTDLLGRARHELLRPTREGGPVHLGPLFAGTRACKLGRTWCRTNLKGRCKRGRQYPVVTAESESRPDPANTSGQDNLDMPGPVRRFFASVRDTASSLAVPRATVTVCVGSFTGGGAGRNVEPSSGATVSVTARSFPFAGWKGAEPDCVQTAMAERCTAFQDIVVKTLSNPSARHRADQCLKSGRWASTVMNTFVREQHQGQPQEPYVGGTRVVRDQEHAGGAQVEGAGAPQHNAMDKALLLALSLGQPAAGMFPSASLASVSAADREWMNALRQEYGLLLVSQGTADARPIKRRRGALNPVSHALLGAGDGPAAAAAPTAVAPASHIAPVSGTCITAALCAIHQHPTVVLLVEKDLTSSGDAARARAAGRSAHWAKLRASVFATTPGVRILCSACSQVTTLLRCDLDDAVEGAGDQRGCCHVRAAQRASKKGRRDLEWLLRLQPRLTHPDVRERLTPASLQAEAMEQARSGQQQQQHPVVVGDRLPAQGGHGEQCPPSAWFSHPALGRCRFRIFLNTGESSKEVHIENDASDSNQPTNRPTAAAHGERHRGDGDYGEGLPPCVGWAEKATPLPTITPASERSPLPGRVSLGVAPYLTNYPPQVLSHAPQCNAIGRARHCPCPTPGIADFLFWTPLPPQVYVLQADEAIAQDGKRRIADVVAELGIRRGSVRAEFATGERTVPFSSPFADPYKDGVRAALRCGGKEPVWTDANPPFAVDSLSGDLPALQSAHGHDMYWRPTQPVAHCSTCAKLVHVERAGDSKFERALAAPTTVYGDLSAVRIMVAPSRCKECECLVPFSGVQQYLYR